MNFHVSQNRTSSIIFLEMGSNLAADVMAASVLSRWPVCCVDETGEFAVSPSETGSHTTTHKRVANIHDSPPVITTATIFPALGK